MTDSDTDINKLIEAEQYTSALRIIAARAVDGNSHRRWRRFFLDPRRPCPLLRAACKDHTNPKDLLSVLQSPEWETFCAEVEESYRHGDMPAAECSLLTVRSQLISTILDTNLPPESVMAGLRGAVTGYAECWSYKLQPHVQSALKSAGRMACPAFFAQLGNSGFETAFKELAAEFSWCHPGLLLVGQTVVDVWSGVVQPEYEVKTWVLLAGEDFGLPTGFLAELTLRRIRGGCGAMFPSPSLAGYTRTRASFQHGLQNAWYAVLGDKLLDGGDYDVDWSLAIALDQDELPIDPRIAGRSAEAAVACALIAIHKGEKLDQRVVITASLKKPGTANRDLTQVGGLDHKLLAKFVLPDHHPELAEELRHAIAKKRIDTVLVATDQPEVLGSASGTAVTKHVTGTNVTLEPVRSLRDAYRRLARFPRLTRSVKKRLAQRANLILDQRCDPYVLSSLSRLETVLVESASAERIPRREEERVPLTEQDVQRVVRGELDQLDPKHNRVRLLADSGLGKSILLVYCEQQIAILDDDRIPLRLGAGPLPQVEVNGAAGERHGERLQLPLLSEVNWADEPQQVLRSLASRLLHCLMPEGEDVDEEELGQWFAQLVRRGEVVFLLDAIDQTDGDPAGLASFLQSAARGGLPRDFDRPPGDGEDTSPFVSGLLLGHAVG